MTNRLEMIIIEIPKAKRIYKENKKDKIGQWMMFLDNPNSKEVEEIMRVNMVIRSAIEDLGAVCGNKRMRRLVELREKGRRDDKAALDYATEEGLKQGNKEARIEIAKEMLENEIDIEVIEKITKLTKKEIQKLKE